MSLAAALPGDDYELLVKLRERIGLDPEVREPQFVKFHDAARLLKIDILALRRLIGDGTIGSRRAHGTRGREFVLLEDLAHALDNQPSWLRQLQSKGQKKGKSARQQELKARRTVNSDRRERQKMSETKTAPFNGSVRVTLPQRHREPESVIAHLGPTNSGKTYEAIEFLAAGGQGVYAAPLRMLAQEAYETLVERLGSDQVGLITGEERLNENAPVIACTTEMAPQRGETLILDEVHWASDRDRGSAWTRLLAAGSYRHIRLVGAADALPLISAAFPRAEIRHHERLVPLGFAGEATLNQLPARTVVIAFSRKVVLALAQTLTRQGARPAVLYGAMPPQARRREIARFISGEAKICVATDVLGHGINLPCDRIVFAETSKWDGERRRDLEAWEIAQIAGRAGRFRLSSEGQVQVLTGQRYLQAYPTVVEASLHPTLDLGNGVRGFRRVEQGRLAPTLSDLNISHPGQLRQALMTWEREAQTAFADEGWLLVESMTQRLERLDAIKRAFARRNQQLSKVQVPLTIEEVWSLVNAPADDGDYDLLGVLARLLSGDERGRVLESLFAEATVSRATLNEAEQLARAARLLCWFSLHYYGVGGVTPERAKDLEERAAERVSSQLQHEIARGQFGYCEECGKECPPWFSRCDSCHFIR